MTHLARQEEQTRIHEDARRQLQHLPKVELHLHLEGMMRPATLRSLCEKNQVPLPAHVQASEAHYFATFDEFVYTYHRICQALAQPGDFALLMADVAAYLRRNHILYAEIAWTPFLYLNRGLRFAEVMEVLNEALEAHNIADRVHFLIDVQRDHGLEVGTRVFEQVFATHNQWRIAGVGLTGQEEGFPPAEYRQLYHQARECGLGTTAHAGEYGTAKDIWQGVQALGVQRIGHGIRAVHDRALLDILANQQIHLEICPTSNVRLQRVLTYSAHPVRTLWQAGIPLGLNTDNPALFGIDLSDEYHKVMEHQGFGLREMYQSLLHSVQASFLSAERKHALRQQLTQGWRDVC
ncbi:MAG: adenosine deaminase [Ktedonobacteraceae bacterium]|nr:adenosine deaminase [Ktedonobacteraceae bacterium]